MRRWLPDTPSLYVSPEPAQLAPQFTLTTTCGHDAEPEREAIQAIAEPVAKHALTAPYECQDSGDVIQVADGWARICLRHQTLSATFHTADWARQEGCVLCRAELDALPSQSRYRALHNLWARG